MEFVRVQRFILIQGTDASVDAMIVKRRGISLKE